MWWGESAGSGPLGAVWTHRQKFSGMPPVSQLLMLIWRVGAAGWPTGGACPGTTWPIDDSSTQVPPVAGLGVYGVGHLVTATL